MAGDVALLTQQKSNVSKIVACRVSKSTCYALHVDGRQKWQAMDKKKGTKKLQKKIKTPR
jgi:hypothetical protein